MTSLGEIEVVESLRSEDDLESRTPRHRPEL